MAKKHMAALASILMAGAWAVFSYINPDFILAEYRVPILWICIAVFGIGVAIYTLIGLFWVFSWKGGDNYIPYIGIRPLALKLGIDIDGRFPPQTNNAYELESALREAAINNLLTVRGRRRRRNPGNHPLVPIPNEHFDQFEFIHGHLGADYPNKATHTGTLTEVNIDDHNEENYYDLYVSKREVKRVLANFKRNDGS